VERHEDIAERDAESDVETPLPKTKFGAIKCNTGNATLILKRHTTEDTYATVTLKRHHFFFYKKKLRCNQMQ
jgi:hypothetical protein